MIHAIIFICSLNHNCVYISDDWGPYQTIDQCLDRTTSMHQSALIILPKYRSVSSHCTKSKFISEGVKA